MLTQIPTMKIKIGFVIYPHYKANLGSVLRNPKTNIRAGAR